MTIGDCNDVNIVESIDVNIVVNIVDVNFIGHLLIRSLNHYHWWNKVNMVHNYSVCTRSMILLRLSWCDGICDPPIKKWCKWCINGTLQFVTCNRDIWSLVFKHQLVLPIQLMEATDDDQ